jgi:hypothetical protein
MKKIFFILIVIIISPYLHPCSPKQVWIPLFIINLDASYDKIGERGNNYVYRIDLYGKFHPGTHSLELNCSQDDCCKVYDKGVLKGRGVPLSQRGGCRWQTGCSPGQFMNCAYIFFYYVRVDAEEENS